MIKVLAVAVALASLTAPVYGQYYYPDVELYHPIPIVPIPLPLLRYSPPVQPRPYYPPVEQQYSYAPPMQQEQRVYQSPDLGRKCALASKYLKMNNCGPQGCDVGYCLALQNGCHINSWGHNHKCP